MVGLPDGARRLLGLPGMRALACVVLALGCAACLSVRASRGGGQVSQAEATDAARGGDRARDIAVPPGYRIAQVADRLTFPTGVAVGPRGELYVVESGYAYGEVFVEPRLLVIERGRTRVLAVGTHPPWTGVAYHDRALFVAQGGVREGGRVVRYDLRGGRVGAPTVLVDDLPSLGDHHTNGPVVHDGWVYFGQGTATNAGVVGTDSADHGWLPRQPRFHDVPCRDVTLAGTVFETRNPLTPGDDQVRTGAFLPFGEPGAAGQRVPGQVPCSGAIMRVPVGGGEVELVAWGFRNPFGLAVGPDGALYATDNGYDVRGSRPVFGAADMLWKVEPGRWYGWPDFAEGRPLTLPWYAEGGGAPHGFVLAEHPGEPPAPAAYLGVHSSADGLDLSRSPRFGHVGQAFVALFGDLAPEVGKVFGPVGFKVVRVDPRTGRIEDFARNRGDEAGPASRNQGRGLERPIAVRFDPAGDALYVVDFGVVRVSDKGPEPRAGTGAIWRITRAGGGR